MLGEVVDHFARTVAIIGGVSGGVALIVSGFAAYFARGEARAVQATHRPQVKFANYTEGKIVLEVDSAHPISKVVVSTATGSAFVGVHREGHQPRFTGGQDYRQPVAKFGKLGSGNHLLTVVPFVKLGGSEVKLSVRMSGPAFGRWTEPLTFNAP